MRLARRTLFLGCSLVLLEASAPVSIAGGAGGDAMAQNVLALLAGKNKSGSALLFGWGASVSEAADER